LLSFFFFVVFFIFWVPSIPRPPSRCLRQSDFFGLICRKTRAYAAGLDDPTPSPFFPPQCASLKSIVLFFPINLPLPHHPKHLWRSQLFSLFPNTSTPPLTLFSFFYRTLPEILSFLNNYMSFFPPFELCSERFFFPFSFSNTFYLCLSFRQAGSIRPENLTTIDQVGRACFFLISPVFPIRSCALGKFFRGPIVFFTASLVSFRGTSTITLRPFHSSSVTALCF